MPQEGRPAVFLGPLCLPQVLHYLAMQKPADLARHLLPCVIHAAVLKVKEEGKCLSCQSLRPLPKKGFWFHF